MDDISVTKERTPTLPPPQGEELGFVTTSLISRYPQLAPVKDAIASAYAILENSFENGGKLLIAGNGGSAADAEHIVGELMKGFVKHRPVDREFAALLKQAASNAEKSEAGDALARKLQGALPAIALTQHSALSTAYANDVDADLVFAQQVYGYGRLNDVFLGISTSGNSRNIVNAMITAQAAGLRTIALTGGNGGEIARIADTAIIAPEKETYKIQELHLPIYHALCLALEDHFFKE
jgi:D-sedoheptulose 7-phosphate isomerase